jgi:hypothetical protein
VSDTLYHTPEGVFLGHMLEVDHGIHNDTPAGAAHEKALAREIFGQCWAIGKCTCLWVTAIQAVIGLIRGQPADPLAPRRRVFVLWHVYGEKPAGSEEILTP